MSRKIERFEFRGFHGSLCICDLELIPIANGRTVVIATEREDNSGTSVTNVAEHLASHVCNCFGINPEHLVWIEYYGYPDRVNPRRPRQYDLVTFSRQTPEPIQWSDAVLRSKPNGWPGHFDEPQWRPMKQADWKELGLEPR